jgi:hypothetical protein
MAQRIDVRADVQRQHHRVFANWKPPGRRAPAA